MNALYCTPCTPRYCDKYTLDPCVIQSVCDKRIRYESLKEVMSQDKDIRGQSFEQRAKGVDAVYKSERGNRHRVGQK